MNNATWTLSEDQVSYGSIASFLDEMIGEDFGIFTVEPPWSECSKLMKKKPKETFLVHETDSKILEDFIPRVKGINYLVGLGGGRAIDSAKYVSLRTGARFISVPTIIGADAYVTPVAAVRTGGIVTYIGNKFPDRIVIDESLIRTAPPRMNRAGVGDIYSTKISLMDWKYARDHEGEAYDESIVREAEEVLRKLEASTKDIYNVTDEGIRAMVRMHIKLNALQWPYVQKGRTWPQEGIEHVFFYSLEKVTGRTFSHGEVLGTGAVIAARIHGADEGIVMKELDSFGLKFRPHDYGISFLDFERAIQNMKAVTIAMNTHYAVLDDRELTDSEIRGVWDILGAS